MTPYQQAPAKRSWRVAYVFKDKSCPNSQGKYPPAGAGGKPKQELVRKLNDSGSARESQEGGRGKLAPTETTRNRGRAHRRRFTYLKLMSRRRRAECGAAQKANSPVEQFRRHDHRMS